MDLALARRFLSRVFLAVTKRMVVFFGRLVLGLCYPLNCRSFAERNLFCLVKVFVGVGLCCAFGTN